jgi:hypothetical protein
MPWEKWVAIDDKPFLPNLMVCDSAVGIDETSIEILRAKLAA